MITRSKSGIFKSKIYTAVRTTEKPENYEQAIKDNNWKMAMDEEYNALIRIKPGTWSIHQKTKTLLAASGHTN